MSDSFSIAFGKNWTPLILLFSPFLQMLKIYNNEFDNKIKVKNYWKKKSLHLQY